MEEEADRVANPEKYKKLDLKKKKKRDGFNLNPANTYQF